MPTVEWPDEDQVMSHETCRRERMTEERRGPLFMVGMPRSGTKLLRDLLNQHPRVGIPRSETQFLPRAIERLGTRPEFGDRDLSLLRGIVENSTFVWNLREQGREYDAGKLLVDLDTPDWTSVARRLIVGGLSQGEDAEIWGDKTPAYLPHIPLLHQTFPSARFIHLVRDPRDRSLSVRRTWGKDILRAADRWEANVMRAHRIAEYHEDVDLLEVRYEDLLDKPEGTLRTVCDFLSLRFDQRMLTLDSPSEAHGDASGRSEIVQGNAGKFRSGLTALEIRRIEEITWCGLRVFGYNVLYATGGEPISGGERRKGRIRDAGQVVRFHLAEKGLVDGTRYLLRLLRADTWRRYDRE